MRHYETSSGVLSKLLRIHLTSQVRLQLTNPWFHTTPATHHSIKDPLGNASIQHRHFLSTLLVVRRPAAYLAGRQHISAVPYNPWLAAERRETTLPSPEQSTWSSLPPPVIICHRGFHLYRSPDDTWFAVIRQHAPSAHCSTTT